MDLSGLAFDRGFPVPIGFLGDLRKVTAQKFLALLHGKQADDAIELKLLLSYPKLTI